jgi:hypothetical protein
MTKIQFELSAKPSKAEKEAFMTIWICACCGFLGSSKDQMLGWKGVKA